MPIFSLKKTVPRNDNFTFDGRQRHRVFPGLVDGGSHGVLEELEENVIEVRRDVDELDRVLPQVMLRPNFANLEKGTLLSGTKMPR